jgi:hypothetical protein
VTDTAKTQEERILWLLQASWPRWVPAPQLARISLQYSSRIHGLRRRGWQIANRVRVVSGKRHGEFRLGTKQVPRSWELRAAHQPAEQQALFPLPEPEPVGVGTPLFPGFRQPEGHRDDG